MSFILHLDTSSLNVNICLSQKNHCLDYQCVEGQAAELLHITIEGMLKKLNISLTQLNGVHIHAGPGSYTGLRIGYATAKGFCYALQKPFISSSSFEILAYFHFVQKQSTLPLLIIDNARIDEWYFAYFENNALIINPCIRSTQEIIEFIAHHHCNILSAHTIEKSIFPISIKTHIVNSEKMILLGYEKLENQQFTDIYQSEPFYCKEAYIKFKT